VWTLRLACTDEDVVQRLALDDGTRENVYNVDKRRYITGRYWVVSDMLVATCAWALVVGRVCYVYYQLEMFSTLVLFALGHYFSGNVNAAVQFVGYSTENSDTRCGDSDWWERRCCNVDQGSFALPRSAISALAVGFFSDVSNCFCNQLLIQY